MRFEALWQDYGIDPLQAVSRGFNFGYIKGERDHLILPNATIDYNNDKLVGDFRCALAVHNLSFKVCGDYIEIIELAD